MARHPLADCLPGDPSLQGLIWPAARLPGALSREKGPVSSAQREKSARQLADLTSWALSPAFSIITWQRYRRNYLRSSTGSIYREAGMCPKSHVLTVWLCNIRIVSIHLSFFLSQGRLGDEDARAQWGRRGGRTGSHRTHAVGAVGPLLSCPGLFCSRFASRGEGGEAGRWRSARSRSVCRRLASLRTLS
jgi:hypothetical protein